MNHVRFASSLAATLLAIAMLAGCAKKEVASTTTEPVTDDAAATSDTSEATSDSSADASGDADAEVPTAPTN